MTTGRMPYYEICGEETARKELETVYRHDDYCSVIIDVIIETLNRCSVPEPDPPYTDKEIEDNVKNCIKYALIDIKRALDVNYDYIIESVKEYLSTE